MVMMSIYRLYHTDKHLDTLIASMVVDLPKQYRIGQNMESRFFGDQKINILFTFIIYSGAGSRI